MDSGTERTRRLNRASRARRVLAFLLGLLAATVAAGSLSAEASAYSLLVSSSADRSNAAPLQGKSVSGNVYVFVSPSSGVTRVRFYLDDPSRSGGPIKTEAYSPWDFAGTSSDTARTANPYDSKLLANGQHTITAAIDKSAGGTDVISSSFTVSNTTGGCTPSPCPDSLLVSSSATRASPAPLAGKTVSGNVYVFAAANSGITGVQFYLNDPQRQGTPIKTEAYAPWDFAGTASGGGANPYNTLGIANGAHSITAAITRSTGVNVVTANFSVSNGGSTCSPVQCSDVLVDLPYTLNWSTDHGFAKDKNNIGTGFTWVDEPTNGAGYVPANLNVTGGQLKLTTTSGLQAGTSNSLDNGLAVGIDAPSQVTLVKTTLVAPPAGTGNSEQGGLWFGVDEKNYVKLVVISTSTGTKIEADIEIADANQGSVSSSTVSVGSQNVVLSLLANPSNRTIKASYKVGGGSETTLTTFTAPGEFFSFDAAGIDPEIGTRSFGGIMASHRNGASPLTYSFDDFAVTSAGSITPPPVPGQISFTRYSYSLPTPTSMAWGPDNRLYVTELFGKIHALTFGAGGTVTADQAISTLGSRLSLGITVDPLSTPSNVILWVSHSNPSTSNGQPNSGIVSRLSGSGFTTRQDVITGLPRAIANHATNSIHFGPDGKLYIAQGGNTGAGAPNNANTEFGTMAEQPLSAALLVADVRNTSFDGSCANTSNIFGPPPCTVTPYATGLRNTYDFAIHSNGNIYAPDNGLGVEGSFPPRPTPPCTGTASTAPWNQGGQNPGPQHDPLNRIVQGKYYGHPNPYRNECVFRDGRYQNVAAPANYTAPIFDLGASRSADGTIEYKGDAFCRALRGNLLIANYSAGDDITRIQLSSNGLSVASANSLLGSFNDPLPLAQSPDGRIFVGEMGSNKVTALTPVNLGCWAPKKPVPTQILDAGGGALGGKLYVVGGKNASSHRSTVDVYNPATDSWSTAPNLPGPAVENPAVVATGGKLYVFGGSTAAFSGAVRNAAVFDPSANQWTALPLMPTARGGVTAQAVGTKIYVLGGMDTNGASLTKVELFDTSTNQWSTAASMGTRRDNPGSALLGGKIYAFGGRTRNADGSSPAATLNSVEAYDPAANSWSGRASMPTGRRTMAVGLLNGRAQLMGGEITSSGGSFPQNEEYDPVTNSWRTLTPMLTPRHGAASGTINGVVYVAGGGPTGGFALSNANEAFSFTAL